MKSFENFDGEGNYIVYAFPSIFGTPTFKINNIITNSFTKVREDAFVNSLGYSSTYQIWCSDYKQNGTIQKIEII